jgi:hypothetical protein
MERFHALSLVSVISCGESVMPSRQCAGDPLDAIDARLCPAGDGQSPEILPLFSAGDIWVSSSDNSSSYQPASCLTRLSASL